MTIILILGVLGLGAGGYLWFKGSQSPLAAIKNGEYGCADIYRVSRLLEEQQEDNLYGRYAMTRFKREADWDDNR